MKFWELLSAFRSEGRNLESVLSHPRWSDPYAKWLQEGARLVSEQRRDVLDSPVPTELSRAVAAKSAMTFRLFRDGYLRGSHSNGVPVEELTALEVHDRFGGSAIEEVLEKGSLRVRELE
ncbi:MAG TPA: hypothetical protein VGQ36_13710 [Thermoanaerobaculia bacterium]|nr:hypothetical protein [Thermoanaerobaculia bacterium]